MSALIALTLCSRQCNLMLASAMVLVVVVVLLVLGTLVVFGIVVLWFGVLDPSCSTSLLISCMLVSITGNV